MQWTVPTVTYTGTGSNEYEMDWVALQGAGFPQAGVTTQSGLSPYFFYEVGGPEPACGPPQPVTNITVSAGDTVYVDLLYNPQPSYNLRIYYENITQNTQTTAYADCSAANPGNGYFTLELGTPPNYPQFANDSKQYCFLSSPNSAGYLSAYNYIEDYIFYNGTEYATPYPVDSSGSFDTYNF